MQVKPYHSTPHLNDKPGLKVGSCFHGGAISRSFSIPSAYSYNLRAVFQKHPVCYACHLLLPHIRDH